MFMNQPIEIFQITEEDAIKNQISPEEPHNHDDFEELIIVMEGSMEHFIDFKTKIFDAPIVSFVTKGKLHRVLPQLKDDKCKMWVIKFKSEFIPDTTFQLYTYYHDHATIKMNEGACFNRMVTLSEMMYDESQQTNPDYSVIRHLLSALFGMIESERKKNIIDEAGNQTTQNITFKNFLRILEENFHRQEGVEFYAEKLFMSSRNLNKICQNILQLSVLEIIETRKLIEAKNLLINTDLTISEIGYEIGYNEKSYFTNVFKKKSGQTPSEFRAEMRKLIS